MRPTVVYPPVYLATYSSSNCSALSARFVPQLALVPRAAAVVRLPPSSLNRPTSSRSWVDISFRPFAAFCESVAPCDVLCAACATP